MRLIDADALREKVNKKKVVGRFNTLLLIDNAPTINDRSLEIAQKSIKIGRKVGQLEGKLERPQGECRTCKHRDPDNKKCDCGALERQGCPFPVNDNYFCKYYAKMGGST